MTEDKKISGGVFCQRCKQCICKPKKRKYFQPDSYIICDDCDPSEYRNKALENFNEEDLEIGDLAYIQTMNHIRKTIKEYLLKDEIKFEIYNAISEGVTSFLDDNCEDIIKEVIKGLVRNISIDMNINHKERK